MGKWLFLFFIGIFIGHIIIFIYEKSTISTKIGYYISTGKWVEIKKGRYYIIYDKKFEDGFKIIIK